MLRRFDTRTAAFLAAVLLLAPACGRRCQAPSEQPFRSVVETPWRLVETTDPQAAKELNNFNFLIYTFARNNTGQVQNVIDNEEYGAVMTMVWVPDAARGMMRIRFSSVSTSPIDSIDQIDSAPTGDQGTYDYSYSLGRELKMRELKRGYTYRFVPFKGIVDPDNLCTF